MNLRVLTLNQDSLWYLDPKNESHLKEIVLTQSTKIELTSKKDGFRIHNEDQTYLFRQISEGDASRWEFELNKFISNL